MPTGDKSDAQGRYDRDTLRKVTALAERLQSRHQETYSASDIEGIGQEVGLAPGFIQQALDQVAEVESALGRKPTVTSVVPSTDRARQREFKSLVGAWAGALAVGLLALAGSGNPAWAMFWTAGAVAPLSLLLGFLAGKRGAGFWAGFALVVALCPTAIILWGWPWGPGANGPGVFPYLTFAPWIGGFLARQGAKVREHYFPISEETASVPVSRPALLNLLFSLQTQLEGQKQHRAFLSVDVVGSSEMKRGAPELAVEYSFSQFRDWTEELIRGCGGEIHSAAGDGLMAVFSTDAGPVRAARLLQEGLGRFNAERNRLPSPFRLRCGATAGEVAIADGVPLGHVHSAVIDRAANLQKQAEPGDIVVSGELAAAGIRELGTLSALPEPVAGETVFSWRAASPRALPPETQ